MIAVVWWLLHGCVSPDPVVPPVESVGLPDVLLVTLDTVRADRIGAYGYAAADTPHIDALAARGRLHTRAWSPVPFTIPAHASILTGLYPATHGIRANGDAVLGREFTTLAEHLQTAGYRTAAAVASFPTTRVWGFDRGFEAYFDDVPTSHAFWRGERPADEVVSDLLGWVEQLGEDPAPRFAWAHFFDAHHPYVPPEPWRSLHDDPYDGEIAWIDAQLGRLLQAFEQRPTLIVLVADHGESLGDHGEETHGLYVYDSTQRVPFVLSGHGIDPAVMEAPTSLVDVLPMVLDHLGLPIPVGLDGTAHPTDDRVVWMESWQLATRFGIAPHLAVADSQRKLISLPRPELYDLTVDPLEQHDRAADDPESIERLQARFEAFGFDPPSADPAHPASLDLTARLSALGYVDGHFDGDLSGPLPDPKDHAEMLGLVQQRDRLERQGELRQLGPVVAELASRWPDVSEFQARHALLVAAGGDPGEASERIAAARSRDPDNALLMQTHAVLLAADGQDEEAAEALDRVARAMPFAPRARALAIAAMLKLPGGADRAVEQGLQYLRAHPDDHHLAGLLGIQLAGRGELPRALGLLEQGVRADIPERDVAFHLAAVRIGQGRYGEAVSLLETEIRHHPRSFQAHATLLALLGRRGAWEEQVRVADRVLESGHARAAGAVPLALEQDAVHARAQALFNLGWYAASRVALDEGLMLFPEDPRLHVLDANLLARESRRDAALAAFARARRLQAEQAKVGP